MASIFAREIRLSQMSQEGVRYAGKVPRWSGLMPVYITTDTTLASDNFVSGITKAVSSISVFRLDGGATTPALLIDYLKNNLASPESDFDKYPNLSREELMGYWSRLSSNLQQEKSTRGPGTVVSAAKRPAMLIYIAKEESNIGEDPIGVEALSVWTYNFLPAVAILGSIDARIKLFDRYRQVLGETVRVV